MTEERALSVVDRDESFEVFELADEEQIIAEISGRVIDSFLYPFRSKGKEEMALSYAGTNWACREYAKHGEVIRIMGKPEVIVDPIDPNYIIAVITAQRFSVDRETGREIALDSTLGVKRQWRMMKKYKYGPDGKICGEEVTSDPFYVEKCFSKAIRNAKQALIPTDIVKKLITEALKLKGSKGSAAAAPRGQSGKPSSAKPRQEEQKPAQPSAPPKEAEKPPPPKSAPAKPSKEVLVQKFEVVLKNAYGTTDGNLARQYLKTLCGTDRITDLSEADIMKYGKILQEVPKGLYRISQDKTFIIDAKTNEVVWGKPPPPPEEPQEEPPPPEEPQPQGSMF